jgi:NAD-dependent dihydropyrimidine dehydrogenase PreA subunit
MNKTDNQTQNIVFCHCGGERTQSPLFTELAGYLEKQQGNVTILSDLCALAVNRKQELQELFSATGKYLLIGCYQRSMKHLLEKVLDRPFEVLNIQHINVVEVASVDEIKPQIASFTQNAVSGSFRKISDDSGWPSWYPVLDYSRCTSCGQCADFCLFGVYEKTDSLVKVVNPKGCKNNCPACARICPSTAIIFPKYKNGGAISGSPDIDEVAEHQRKLQDMESIMGDDIYAALAQRKAKRQSIIREEVMRKAHEERDNALNELKK